MTRYIAPYCATLAVMFALDMAWLGAIARPLYQQGIGHLLAETPNVVAAALFYAVYALGLVVFAIAPNAAAGSWGRTLASASLFGLCAYATYDLTNLATLRNWPLALSLVDMAWGCLISACGAAAGKLVLGRLASG